jgi:hypothetical protein
VLPPDSSSTEAGETQRAIAAKVGLNQTTVGRVLNDASSQMAETHHDTEPKPPKPRAGADAGFREGVGFSLPTAGKTYGAATDKLRRFQFGR